MTNAILNLYKEIGETPLERVERFRVLHPEYREARLSYLGRLDPMAEGVLLVGTEAVAHERDSYLALPKRYDCEALFGLASDTHDILGLVERGIPKFFPKSDELSEYLSEFLGIREQQYPWYSSKTLGGVAMHELARSMNRAQLDEIARPTTSIEIFNLHVLETYTVKAKSLKKSVTERIEKVKGDFRQREILNRWEEVCADDAEYSVARMYVSCSRGTYIRSLVHELGERLHCGAIALSITRKAVGPYTISDAVRES